MSESIKTVFLNFSVCALICGILEFIMPVRNKKTMRIIAVGVLILSVLSVDKTGFSGEIFNAFEEAAAGETVTGTTAASAAGVYKKTLYAYAEETLISLGLDEYEIYIDISADETAKSVTLNSISIVLGTDFSDRADEVKKAFSDEYSEVLTVGVKKNE